MTHPDTTERAFDEVDPRLEDKGPAKLMVRSLQSRHEPANACGWYYIGTIDLESKWIGGFYTRVDAVGHGEANGYSFSEDDMPDNEPDIRPATKNSSAPLNPPEQNEAEVSEIRSCPCCGGDSCQLIRLAEDRAGRRYRIICGTCGTTGALWMTPNAALSAWNKRAG